MVHLPRLELLDGTKKGLRGHLVILSNSRPDMGTARGVGVLPMRESRVTRVSIGGSQRCHLRLVQAFVC